MYAGHMEHTFTAIIYAMVKKVASPALISVRNLDPLRSFACQGSVEDSCGHSSSSNWTYMAGSFETEHPGKSGSGHFLVNCYAKFFI